MAVLKDKDVGDWFGRSMREMNGKGPQGDDGKPIGDLDDFVNKKRYKRAREAITDAKSK